MPNSPTARGLTVGQYILAPLVKALDNGWFACSVSIRSGYGKAHGERVLRVTRLFRDRLQAAEYAIGEGLQWLGQPRRLVPVAA